MATLGMLGSYDFNAPEIDRVVAKTSPGNYALGYVKEYNFYVRYIGRSDSDVNKELKARLPLKHLKFKYSYATSAKAAFEKECQNYHAFGGSEGLENRAYVVTYFPNRLIYYLRQPNRTFRAQQLTLGLNVLYPALK